MLLGVLDVDCPNNGLCCFNGCANRCVKNCYDEVAEECVAVEEDECRDEPAETCEDVEVTVPCEPVCENVVEKVCKDVVVQVGCLGLNSSMYTIKVGSSSRNVKFVLNF